MQELQVRLAQASDLPRINDIYNYYVRQTHVTFDLEPWSLDKRKQWFEQFNAAPYQLWVCEINKQVEAFAYTSQFRAKAAYNASAEVTIYARHQVGTKGIGKALYGELLSHLGDCNLHRLYAVIALPNEPSMGLHKALGFKQVGALDEVGSKFGQPISVAMLEKKL